MHVCFCKALCKKKKTVSKLVHQAIINSIEQKPKNTENRERSGKKHKKKSTKKSRERRQSIEQKEREG